MRKLFFLILLHPLILLYSQTEIVNIQWNRQGMHQSFPFALYEDGVNTLPYFTRKIPWNDHGTLPVVGIRVMQSTEIPGGHLDEIKHNHLKKNPLVEYSLARESGRSFVMLKVLPYVRNSDGKVHRVDRFEIQLEQEAALAPLKSARAGTWKDHSILASGSWF